MSKLQELAHLGQSIWLDYIRRSFIQSGDFAALIAQGLRGVTSNPTIFEKAIAGSNDYDDAIRARLNAGKPVQSVAEELFVEDIAHAADLLLPVYQSTDGLDGYVSLEVSPTLAHDTAGTIAEARRLFSLLGRPNVMIKVPATPEGLPAIETLIREGVNVNVTLIFSVEQYAAVAEAFLRGMEGRAKAGQDLHRVASVASFFVSRLDTLVDAELERLGRAELAGKAGISAARLVYERFLQIFQGPRWEALVKLGARPQRPLWASTGTKNPLYPDTMYVDNLIAPQTVNTLPPATLQAFLDHGVVEIGIDEARITEAHEHVRRLAEAGIDLTAVGQKLLADGVRSFAASYESLLQSLEEKRRRLRAGVCAVSSSLGHYQSAVERTLASLEEKRIVSRIWSHDHTVWRPEPTEITDRLGWLHIIEPMLEALPRLESFAEKVRAAGYTHALLLGMGGSSLAPEVMRKVFGVAPGYLDLGSLDSTSPEAVLSWAERLDPARTLFIVSTKSGTTVETLSLFKFFYNWTLERLGPEEAGRHFVAITDPGTSLAKEAAALRFRSVFLNDPNIGGRFSALSYVGLVPAALIGADLRGLLESAQEMALSCEPYVAGADNPGAWLGAILGALAEAGRDKLTLLGSPAVASFGDWVEQLIAESTGKDGKGILPVVNEPLGEPAEYGGDRLFVYTCLEGEESPEAQERLAALQAAGHPIVTLKLRRRQDLGGQMFLWEFATAVAGHILGIHPFDQPNVEAAKKLARQMLAAYQRDGALPLPAPALQHGGLALFGEGLAGSEPAQAIRQFLAQAQPGAYIALQAYLPPAPELDRALEEIRLRLRRLTRLPVTVGYGPRFLHSTGQLHKGDAGRGLFIQFTADHRRDVPIPDAPGSSASSVTFGTLIMAQALGDFEALLQGGRRVMRLHLGQDVLAGLEQMAQWLE